MRFHDRNGYLSTIDTAVESLKDISENVKPEWLLRNSFDQNISAVGRYDIGRLERIIYRFQYVIWLNGGTEPITWLPKYFEPEFKYKMYT